MQENNKIKIGFLSEFDPMDKKASSGTNFKCAEELKKIGNLSWIPFQKTIIGKITNKICFLINKYAKKNYFVRLTKQGASLCFQIPSREQLDQFDIIVAFFCSPVLSKIKTSAPIIYLSDATFPVLINYYPSYSNIGTKHLSQILEMEKQAYLNADKLVLASDWAAAGAQSLGIDNEKIEVIEYGANFDDKDLSKIQNSYISKHSDKLSCIFLGVDWNRKGGKIAVDTINWLNENGIPAQLNIVGCNPPKEFIKNPHICILGFLNKNNPADYQKLVEAILNADILLLPTMAECAGIVFAESSAYGLPIFTYDTGGISNYVYNGINGYRLAMGSSGKDFGKLIKICFESQELSKLAEGGKKLYTEKLNWTCWRKRMERIILELINKPE